jgi:glucosamine--fructose-6-phosphate aminotransferase (isomerizing)
MCGIVAYVGSRDAAPILVGGLKRLEYRGYDSAGVAIIDADGRLQVRKQEGKLARLQAKLEAERPALSGQVGLGHTRWATHGPPTTVNAHPHHDEHQRIALVHNGIIENYAPLRAALRERGHIFETETDTEVLVHLIEEAWYGAGTGGREAASSDAGDSGAGNPARRGSNLGGFATGDSGASGAGTGPAFDRDSPIRAPERFAAVVREVLARVEGAYALAVMAEDLPQSLVVARHFSPLVLGLGEGENFAASDIPALLEHSRDILLLEDGELALIEPGGISLSDMQGRPIQREPMRVTWDAAAAEKGGYEHFVRKEIDEQPRALTDTLRGRLEGDAIHLPELDALDLDTLRRVIIVACGTSYYAGMIGKLLIERWARLPVEVAVASELRYGDPVLGAESLVILVSQSGETADTLAALRRARAAGAPSLAITNTLGSSITRLADATLYLQVGPEIGVVATKTFTGQLAILTLLAAELGRRRGHMSAAEIATLSADLRALPAQIARAIEHEPAIRAAAEALSDRRSIFFIGRGFEHPIALEAALKLKEISYIHAEGYPAGELKHGPIAMLDPSIPVFAFATPSATYDKLVSNVEEVRARAAQTVLVAAEDDHEIERLADYILRVPAVREELAPFINAVPAQLFAYHAARHLGHDVDQPRNLAKSVTVE